MTDERFQNRYRIPSTRLPSWDYTAAGHYFITICTYDRISYFGEIHNGEMYLSPLGKIAHQFWVDIPNHFPKVTLDEFMVMPNHIHGIIVIKSNADHDPPVETQHAASLQNIQNIRNVQNIQCIQYIRRSMPKPGSISAIIRSYKSAVTRWAGQNGYSDFAWQARFYDHIIRNETSLEKIQMYIRGNPIKWETDDYNPMKTGA